MEPGFKLKYILFYGVASYRYDVEMIKFIIREYIAEISCPCLYHVETDNYLEEQNIISIIYRQKQSSFCWVLLYTDCLAK